MNLPENLREKLKKPLGYLIKNSMITRNTISDMIPQSSFLITVGDATTEKIIKLGLVPSLQIVDSLEKRNKRALPEGNVKTLLKCKNPPAQITDESISVIKNAFGMNLPVRIIVEGEEDLLVLPVVLYAPDNSVVLYGQPDEGLVLVHVDTKMRDNAKLILESMN